MRALSQVLGVDASPVVAGVQDVERWHVSVVNGEANSMCVVGLAIDTERTIALALRSACPLPTFILSLPVDLAPEVSDVSWGDVH